LARAALSELYAALILVAVTLSLGALAYGAASDRLGTLSQGLGSYFEGKAKAAGALLTSVYFNRSQEGLTLLLYNYGWSEARLLGAIADGRAYPLNATIPPSSLYALTLPTPRAQELVLLLEGGETVELRLP
jgi:flagellin-like protein